tara:strand:- start:16203 stop:17375 length:1173 start_codon:yes stop_codon:yes gene_type:complete
MQDQNSINQIIAGVEAGILKHVTVNAAEQALLDAAGAKDKSLSNDVQKSILANDVTAYAARHGCKAKNSSTVVRMLNNASSADFGSKVDLTTLTEIKRDVVRQKFYTAEPSTYMHITANFGAWSEALLIYKAFQTAGAFEEGIVGHSSSGRIPSVRVDYAPQTIQTRLWNMSMEYNTLLLNRLSQSSNGVLNVIQELEVARKTTFDLGLQNVLLNGTSTDTEILSLINQPTVTANTTTIVKSISSMTDAEFNTLLANMFAAYATNSDNTSMADTFVISTSDWNGLASVPSASFPTRSKLEMLKTAFKEITNNPSATILPLAYCDTARNDQGANVYVLYRNTPEVLEAHLPVAYTTTTADTNNNFQFQSIAYGQYSGVTVYRPKEMLYFTY